MTSWIDQIRELNDLRAAGLLTEDEFDEQKKLLLPSNAPKEQPAPIPKEEAAPLPTFGLSEADKRQRAQRHAELGGGPFGHYEKPLYWVCHAHIRAWCEKCSDLDRSTRGQTTQDWRRGKRWVCFKHRKNACLECRRLDG